MNVRDEAWRQGYAAGRAATNAIRDEEVEDLQRRVEVLKGLLSDTSVVVRGQRLKVENTELPEEPMTEDEAARAADVRRAREMGAGEY